ncbi:rod shape-determining protein MreD [Candidatus Enterovibrio altilux]|uniref:Rod shape-determining protein MreD n=1 Tax=Candidatus Enterovibrio altilux TaxID=1927128 RepID=A0A291B9U3_9GAMM|nr:rod shape-determining protein MreD [Candidatus Enterovibrio luxaltus]ATF09770.1 Rod shape-determining protein MreD [Candidatus Enterovibrio luxaltus]
MTNFTLRNHVLIWLSFIVALMLQAAPWPGELASFRPSWVLLVAFYWVLAVPHRINIGTAIVLGLLWDLMIGSTLGVRGLMMSVLIYIVALNCQLLINMSLWQQAALLSLLMLVGKVLEFWAEYLVSDVKFDPNLLWSGVLNFLLWPWLFFLLRRVRRKFSIK